MKLHNHNVCSRKKEDIQLRCFSLSEVSRAADNFLVNNNQEERGFRPVYKVYDMI